MTDRPVYPGETAPAGSPGTAGNTGSVTTGAPAVTTPATTASSAAAADVGITGCTVDPNDNTFVNLTGTIVNHDTQTDDYDITITFLQGSTRVGSTGDLENAITAGQNATWSTSGSITPINTGTVTCQLSSVSRTPST